MPYVKACRLHHCLAFTSSEKQSHRERVCSNAIEVVLLLYTKPTLCRQSQIRWSGGWPGKQCKLFEEDCRIVWRTVHPTPGNSQDS